MADISAPTQDSSNVVKHMKTIPIRSVSSSSTGSHQRLNASKSKDISSPEKVIKAMYNYQAQSPGELSFVKGDFFHVLTEDREWYDASNPSDGKRGMVPKSYFEIFGRTRPGSVNGSGSLDSPSQHQQGQQMPSKMGSLYAIVLYDFQAEKSDELTSYAGENLFVCAHHNYEWFIAKPIGRLGGPGLVPVGFVSIIDINTGYATGNDVREDIKFVNLPTVQEWKGNIAKYKASNISLGSVEQQQTQQQQQQPDAFYQQHYQQPQNSTFITHAAVNSFSLEGEKYWFNVVCELSNGHNCTLKRYYEDFYDLQVKLLDSFPAEAGKLRDSRGQWTERIVPYIPGPVPYVTDTITKKRRDDLDTYVKDLIALPPHISRSELVKSLFTIRRNGFDREFTQDTTMKTDTISLAPAAIEIHDINRKNEDSTLTGEDLKLYEKLNDLSLKNATPKSRPPSILPPQVKPTKIKFYYKDDIFALLLNSNITFTELRSKIAPRIDTDEFKLFVKLGDEVGEEITKDVQVAEIIHGKLKISVCDA